MIIANIVLYIIIFMIGTLFGSFFTLAIYRIPKKQDIIHTHSYCPNCNHKLGFLDLFPIFSYLALKGKCRHCGQKIRPRYVIIEFLSGITFLLFAYFINLDSNHLTPTVITSAIFMVLYLCFIFLMAGIDAENRKIEKSVMVYGIFISLIYIAYLCIIEKASIYRYVIYFIFYLLILLLDTITLKKYAKNSYMNQLLLSIIVMAIFNKEYIAFSTVICTLLAIAISLILYKVKNLKNRSKRHDKQIFKKLPLGLYLAISNVTILLFALFITHQR